MPVDSTLLFTLLLSFTKLIFPNLTNSNWSKINLTLQNLLQPLYRELCMPNPDLDAITTAFTKLLNESLKSWPEFHRKVKTIFKKTPRAILIAKEKKNELRKLAFKRNATPTDKQLFFKALDYYNYLLKTQHAKNFQRLTKFQEKLYHSDFWSFAKKTVNNLFTTTDQQFISLETANTYFKNKYSEPPPINLTSFPFLPTTPAQSPFNLDPIKPKDIRSTLSRKPNTSASGPDYIYYGFLKHLPCTHLFLATLYNKVLLTGSPPKIWSLSKITLIHKKGDPARPENYRMIALSSCIAKTLHLILANRFQKYLLHNSYIDSNIQKGFLSNISGCSDHNTILQEIIAKTKSERKTVHITWFDLEDAFGSVHHSLISKALQRYNFPPQIISYIQTLYSNMAAQIQTPEWSSSPFYMKKGVFQGDPLSPLIFLAAFNPIIEFLKSKSSSGFPLDNHTKVITTPFADDFNLITTNKSTHQKIITQLNDLTNSLGLKLKPTKCNSLSIASGKPTNIQFALGDTPIPSIQENPIKFLGAFISYDGKPQETYNYLASQLKTKLSNIDKSPIRNEFKIRIYKDYLLPSLRFSLTIQDLHTTHLSALDKITSKYLKSWSGLPRSATLTIFHDPKLLGIKSIKHLYLESHTLSFAKQKLQNDPTVISALTNKEARESKWTKKSSTIKQTSAIYNDTMVSLQANPTISQINSKIKQNINSQTSLSYLEKIKSLTIQGNFIQLLHEQNKCTSWLSFIYNVPQGLMKFILNASLDTLPTNSNLKRWGKRSNSKCKHCSNHETLHHILNNCKIYLDQGRYTWRHNNVLSFISSAISSAYSSLPTIMPTILTDLPTFAVTSQTTIPIELIPTNLRPDLTLIWHHLKQIAIIELSIPFETNIYNRHTSKHNKYSPLVADLESRGWETTLLCFEVGSRGLITSQNSKTFLQIFPHTMPKKQANTYLKKVSEISVTSSFSIWNTRLDLTWPNPPLLNSF
mgnify:CR=1 FL=1